MEGKDYRNADLIGKASVAEEAKYRYADLTGKARIVVDGEFISVTLLDLEVNPKQRPLLFFPPIKSDDGANPTGSDPIEREIDMIAGFDLAWFNYHTREDGMRFRIDGGGFAEKWEDLEIPDAETMPRMDPVKPRVATAGTQA
jgi:hypothetical protein